MIESLSEIRTYDNGSQIIIDVNESMDDITVHFTYNTGDQVWFKCVKKNFVLDYPGQVIKIITHDGLYWKTGMKDMEIF